MDLSEQKLLENDFVRLEPLRDRHRGVLRPLADEAELWALTSVRADGVHFDPWFYTMHAETRLDRQISYAVFDKLSGRYGGHSAFLSIVPEHQRVEIGWTWYGAEFRGTHVNPAAKRLMLERAFEAGAERVELKTHGRNERSQRAMEKLGAVREGVLRSQMNTWTGERRDTVYYSVLKEEWPDVMAGLDRRLTAMKP